MNPPLIIRWRVGPLRISSPIISREGNSISRGESQIIAQEVCINPCRAWPTRQDWPCRNDHHHHKASHKILEFRQTQCSSSLARNSVVSRLKRFWWGDGCRKKRLILRFSPASKAGIMHATSSPRRSASNASKWRSVSEISL